MSKIFCGNGECGAYLGSMGADSCVNCGWIDPGAIEAAATEPLLQRIAELEKERDEWKHDALNGANAQYLREKNTELKRQLEDARNHALEEAAKVCDGVAYTHQNASMLGPEQNALKCAAAIRALKGAKE